MAIRHKFNAPLEVIMKDVPDIILLESDCDGFIPEEAGIPYSKAPPDHVRYWREKMGTYLRNLLNLFPDLPRDTKFSLTLPRSYALYESTRESGACDYYLLGASKLRLRTIWRINGMYSSERFDSPENFVMHAKWLALGRPPQACECEPCTKTPQGEITKRLTLNGAKISRSHKGTSTLRKPRVRKARKEQIYTAGQSRRDTSELRVPSEELSEPEDRIDSFSVPDE